MYTAIDRVLEEAIAEGKVPGVVAIAVNEDGNFYEGTAGKRALGDGPDMTLDTVFWLASMTKAITSIAAMQLVERQLVTLDEPLAAKLPQLAEVQVLEGFDENNEPRFRAPKRQITLRHLLTHTAGFAYPVLNADLWKLHQQTGQTMTALDMPMVTDPGERWEYGVATDWAGRLVEHLSGQNLEDYFRENIFAPLGMSDTSFQPGPDQIARLATRYQRKSDGSLEKIEVNPPEYPWIYSGGGGLFSTGPDYARFLQMLLRGGELNGNRVLDRSTVFSIGEDHLQGLTVGDMRSVNQDAMNDIPASREAVSLWGLAGMINTVDFPTGRTAGSWTWAGVCNTYFWVDPTRKIAGILMAQLLPGSDPDVLKIYAAFERAIYDALGES